MPKRRPSKTRFAPTSGCKDVECDGCEETTSSKRPVTTPLAEIDEPRTSRRTAEASTQSTVTLPSRVAAVWNCNVPEAETIVDTTNEQAQEELQVERLAPETKPCDTMADDKSANTQEELVGSADANCAQID